MNTSIKGLNMELTDAISAYVQERVDGLAKLAEAFEPAVSVRAECGKTTHHHNKGPVFRCEFNMTVPGAEFRAEEEREDLYEAIDVASADLKRQLVEHKERLQDRHHGPRPDKM